MEEKKVKVSMELDKDVFQAFCFMMGENLICLFKESIEGRIFPEYISREMYEEAKNGKYDKALTAYKGIRSALSRSSKRATEVLFTSLIN